jgi:hypothetical protein
VPRNKRTAIITMATKKTKAAAAGDDLDELFEGIGGDAKAKTSTKGKPTSAASKAMADQDILAELEDELKTQQPSRPHTPRIKETAPKGSPAKRATAGTPPPATDDKPGARKSTDSARSLRTSFTPSATSSELQESEKKGTVDDTPAPAVQSGGGWWGGILSTATAAMTTAQAAVKEIQQNEEAKRWADQVRGNVGALRHMGKLILLNLSVSEARDKTSSRHNVSKLDSHMSSQATNSEPAPYQPLQTSSTPSPRPSVITSASSFTSPTTWLVTRLSIPSSTASSRA